MQGVCKGFSWREGYLLGIVLVGKVFTNDFPGGNGIYVLGIFLGRRCLQGNFLGCRQILEAPWPDPVSKAVSDVPQGHHRGARFFYQARH